MLLVNILGAIVVVAIALFVLYQLHAHDQLTAEKWAPMVAVDTWRYYLLVGLQNTLVAAAYSIVLAVVFGLLFGVGRLSSSRIVRWTCGVIVEFFRAVPGRSMRIGGWIFYARVRRDGRA